jgi:hypothetical protein
MSLSSEALAELLAQPALSPPPGVTPDFDNPPNSNCLAWFVTTLCMVIATLCLFLRLFSRCWLEKKLRVEEGICGLEWVLEFNEPALTVNLASLDDWGICMSRLPLP